MVTRGCAASQTCTPCVLWAERLSQMRWISRRFPWVATTWSRKRTNAALVCRAAGMRGRIQVEPDDVGGLALEVGIRARDVALQTVRLEAGTLPDPMHRHVAQAEPRSQPARSPVGVGLGRRLLGESENLRFDGRGQTISPAVARPIPEPGHALRHEALAPPRDGGITHGEARAQGRVGSAICQRQDQLRPLHEGRVEGARVRHRLELGPLAWAQDEGLGRRKHAPIYGSPRAYATSVSLH